MDWYFLKKSNEKKKKVVQMTRRHGCPPHPTSALLTHWHYRYTVCLSGGHNSQNLVLEGLVLPPVPKYNCTATNL